MGPIDTRPSISPQGPRKLSSNLVLGRAAQAMLERGERQPEGAMASTVGSCFSQRCCTPAAKAAPLPIGSAKMEAELLRITFSRRHALGCFNCDSGMRRGHKMVANDRGHDNPSGRNEAEDDDIDLSHEEGKQVRERASVDSYVVHEVIRRQGRDELRRPLLSLFWSGIAAGIAIPSSVLGRALLEDALPDAPWRPMVASLGYTLGFLIVILGRMQLFTESTLSATIPVATHPSISNLLRLLRLWSIVFVANMLGTFVIMLLVGNNAIGYPDQAAAMLELSKKLLEHGPLQTMLGGIPAGFLLAAVAWSLPVGRGQEFWIILFFTYFIGLGEFSHVVAGSAEAWLLVLSGEAGLGFAIFGFILPALVGNIIGGTLIFSLLAHAQVSTEIDGGKLNT